MSTAAPQPAPIISFIKQLVDDNIADELLVERVAAAMRDKLAKKRREGRGGWHHADARLDAKLRDMLREHVGKGDMVDVINIAGMLHVRAELYGRAAEPADSTAPKSAPKKTVARKKPAIKRPAAKPARPAAPRKKRLAAPRPQASRAGKAECIADYRKLKAKHGAKLTRRIFVDNAATGRRYEKLWGNSWPKFVKEADGATPASTSPAPSKPPAGNARKPKADKPKEVAKPAAPKKDEKPTGPWTVKLDGKKIGATIFDKKPGDRVALGGAMFTAKSVDAEKREIHVEKAGQAPEPAGAPLATSQASEPAQQSTTEVTA